MWWQAERIAGIYWFILGHGPEHRGGHDYYRHLGGSYFLITLVVAAFI